MIDSDATGVLAFDVWASTVPVVRSTTLTNDVTDRAAASATAALTADAAAPAGVAGFMAVAALIGPAAMNAIKPIKIPTTDIRIRVFMSQGPSDICQFRALPASVVDAPATATIPTLCPGG